MNFENPSIRLMIDFYYKDSELVQNFENKIESIQKIFSKLPNEFNTTQMSLKEYELLMLTDYKSSNKIIQKEINQEIKFLYVIFGYKFNELLKSTLLLFENGNFYSAISLIRTITENNCQLYHAISKIEPLVEEINNYTEDFLAWNQTHTKIENIIKLAGKGSKINAVINTANNVTEAKSVLTSIDFVSKNKKYSSIRDKYNILCEYVHPNKMSNEIFGIITELHDLAEEKYFEKEKVHLISGELDRYFKKIPEKYSINLFTYFGLIINIVDMNIDLYSEISNKIKTLNVNRIKVKPPYFDDFSKLPDELKREIIKESKKINVSK